MAGLLSDGRNQRCNDDLTWLFQKDPSKVEGEINKIEKGAQHDEQFRKVARIKQPPETLFIINHANYNVQRVSPTTYVPCRAANILIMFNSSFRGIRFIYLFYLYEIF